MNAFNLKSYFVFLGRNKMYTAINVAGLAVSLALAIIIGLYVQHEKTLDHWQHDADRIYLLGGCFESGEAFDGSHWRIQKKLTSRYPEIEQTCAVVNYSSTLIQNEAGTKARVSMICTDSTFLSMFSYPLEVGNRATALEDKSSVIINHKTARLLFSDDNPIGKTVLITSSRDTMRLHVTAIMDEMRETTLPPADIITRFEVAGTFNFSLVNDRMGNATGANVFIKTKPGTNLPAKTKDMAEYFKTFFWVYQMPGCAVSVNLTKFTDLHFAKMNGGQTGTVVYGDNRLVNIMLGAGLAVLLFALMNYINLTVAQGGFRAREMAMRRLLGSQRRQIIMRLIGESFALCALSLVLALLLAAAFLPAANALLDVDIRFADLLTPINIGVILVALVVFSVASGIAPAWIISAAKPIEVVRGTFRQRTKMLFSKVFIVLQNVITIVMLAAALTMALQVRHLVNAPLGYSTDRLMQIPNEARDSVQQATFMQELKKLPCVEIASAGYGIPLTRGNNNTMELNGKTISFQIFEEDTAFMRLTGLELLKDNRTAAENGNLRIFVNRQALREQGLDMNATHIQYYNQKLPIDGILKDFQIGNITAEAHPVIVAIKKSKVDTWNYTLKYRGDAVAAFNQVNELHKKVFDVDIDTSEPVFIDQQIQDAFKSNICTMRLVSIFTVVAIVISLMGLVAMSTYFIEQRKREIAVRRVFGGSTKSILARLIRSFMLYSLVAFIIAIPIIYYLMSDWLAGFSYRISLSPLIFLVAGIASAAISFLAVYFQSQQAANANPAITIKDNG